MGALGISVYGLTTAVQLKNKIHFGWGSAFLQKYRLNAIGMARVFDIMRGASASMLVPRLPYTRLDFLLPEISMFI